MNQDSHSQNPLLNRDRSSPCLIPITFLAIEDTPLEYIAEVSILRHPQPRLWPVAIVKLFPKMAPGLLNCSSRETVPSSVEAPICSDPSVVVSDKASKRTRELWWLHGHPHSKFYGNTKLVSLAALVRYSGQIYKGHKAFLYPNSETDLSYGSMTWDQFDQITERIAIFYARQIKGELREANDTGKQPTIALLGSGRTVQYFCIQLALQKLGVRVLLLAESNALNAIHHLLESCDVSAIITDFKNANIDTIGIRKLKMIDSFPTASTNPTDVDAIKFQNYKNVWELHTFIIHSSGSTGMPKPIIHTNRSMMLIARMYRLFPDFDIENWFLLFPLNHIAGICIALSGLPNGQITSFPPLSLPISSSNLFAVWKELSSMGHPVECVHCPPTLIENMYDYILETGGDFSPLASLKILQPGGAVLSNSIIEVLTAKGVNVKTTYGSTEIGPPFRSIPHTRNNPKCYTIRNLYPDNPFIKMEKVAENLYECVVYKGFELAAELWDGKAEDEPYRTSDLFIQDPPGSGLYVMQGRRDDIFVHTNGENTSAGPLQLDIQASSKIINKALVVGHSKPCTALLVEVHENYDPTSEWTTDQIWEKVQNVNARYPGHSQLMRSMIYILPTGNSLPITPKGNVMRKEAERLYANEISQLYNTMATPPSIPSQESLTDFLRNLLSSLSNIPPTSIQDWTTFSSLGIDSRHTLAIRSSLSSYLNRQISLSSIHENPSISNLTSVFSQSPGSKSNHHRTLEILSKLTSESSTWGPHSGIPYLFAERETVLLTGASGSLGTALLQTFSSSPKIEKIFALVRGPNHISKLKSNFEERDMDTSILKTGGKIEILNFSMQDPLLGVNVEKYYEMVRKVTVVVQNAWKMDFNLGVEEFEGDCLRSTMNLLRFTHAGRPKRFVFSSSISTCDGPGQSLSSIPESALISDPTVAGRTGYAQSKYIVERLLQTLPARIHIPITILRLGQITASTQTGHWNTQELWPILISTSVKMGTIPLFKEKTVDWIPVDVAANSIAEVLLSRPSSSTANEAKKKQGYEVHNIVNPHSIPWARFLDFLDAATAERAELRMARASMREWVTALASHSDSDIGSLPGLRLLAIFEDMAALDEAPPEGRAQLRYETGKSETWSKSLRTCGAVCEEWVCKTMGVWRGKGFV
ncbi:hypothetical protein B7494_g6372 [Chlorociboria aeruginascens]|nr:hypothetical protein B7494_g6372 [Chlorociboria aeruginascens]